VSDLLQSLTRRLAAIEASSVEACARALGHALRPDPRRSQQHWGSEVPEGIESIDVRIGERGGVVVVPSTTCDDSRDGCARRPSGRRVAAFHRSDVLWEAWKRVKRNKGAAGVDAQTLADVREYGEERFIEELQAVLRAGRYRPQRPCEPQPDVVTRPG